MAKLLWNAWRLDEAASAILGEKPLVEKWVSASGRTASLLKQRIKLAGNIKGPTVSALRHKIKGTVHQIKPKNVDITRRCGNCEGPISKTAGKLCSACFVDVALEKRAGRELRVNEYQNWYEFWEEYAGCIAWQYERNGRDNSAHRRRTMAEPDFVPALIAEEEGLIPHGEGPLAQAERGG